jgi:hypothetical protein
MNDLTKRIAEIASNRCHQLGFLPDGDIFNVANDVGIEVAAELTDTIAMLEGQLEYHREGKLGQSSAVDFTEQIARQAADRANKLKLENNALRSELEETRKYADELTEHEGRKHERLAAILGRDDSLEECAKRIRAELEETKARLEAKEPKCPINPTANGFNYTVSYGGGIGPDVWDAQRNVSAVDIRDALNQCGDIVDSGSWIFSIEQNDYPEPNAVARILALESQCAKQKDAMDMMDAQIAALFWTSDDGSVQRDGAPEDADAPSLFCGAWSGLRKALSAPLDLTILPRMVEFLDKVTDCAIVTSEAVIDHDLSRQAHELFSELSPKL